MVALPHGLVWPSTVVVLRQDCSSSRGAGRIVLAAVVPAPVALLCRLVWPSAAAVQRQDCGGSSGASRIVSAAAVPGEGVRLGGGTVWELGKN